MILTNDVLSRADGISELDNLL